MRAGRLSNKITIQEPIKITNNYGEQEIRWVLFKKVWSGISPLRGREYFENQKTNNINYIRITIRYISTLKDIFRIVYGERIFQIKAIIDKNEKHTYLELMCEEII